MDRGKIQSILSDDELFNICDIYNPRVSGAAETPSRDYFKKHFEKVAGEEILIPLLGMQGVGKSTFINALVMQDNVLPVDALETTCVPIEVRYSKNQNPQILIYLMNGEVFEISKKELEEYATEELNPSNKKGVDKAVILINNPLLEDGVVLVDLPGVGSTTQANVQVTQNYLSRLVAAIYLLKVYQPISRTEALFIRNSVNDLGVFWFIQNRWGDDRDTQVKEAEEHNQSILKEIVDKPDYIPQIYTIKVKQAFDAKMKNEPTLYKDSNIEAFVAILQEFKKTRHESMFYASVGNLSNYLVSTVRRVETFIKDASDSYENIEKDVSEKLARFRDIQSQNDELYSRIKNTISEFENDTVPAIVNQEIRSFSNLLRDKMHQRINAGIVDGEDLNRAFGQTVQPLAEDSSLNIIAHIEDFMVGIRGLADNFKIVDPEFRIMTAGEFRREQKTKYEKSLPIVGGVVGGAVGGLLASLIAAGPATGGVSWLVAGAVAVAGIIGGFIGDFFKGKAVDSRKAQAKNDLEKSISESGRDFKRQLNQLLDDYLGTLKESMDKFIAANREETKNRMQQESDRLNQDLNTGAERVESLKSHLKVLEEVLEELK